MLLSGKRLEPTLPAVKKCKSTSYAKQKSSASPGALLLHAITFCTQIQHLGGGMEWVGNIMGGAVVAKLVTGIYWSSVPKTSRSCN